MFACLVGEQLSEIVSDLLSGFSGGERFVVAAPLTSLNLVIPDLVIVILILSTLLALPYIVLSVRCRAEPL